MNCYITIIGPRDKKKEYPNSIVINTTSCSSDFGKGLSPFYLGPCNLYDGWISKTVENAWQYSKVYEKHATDGEPNDGYWNWAYSGWNSSKGERYPMGKGAKPLYSLWNGEKLNYIEARRKIYIPVYSEAARKSEAYKQLKDLYDSGENLVMWDFDGYETNLEMEEIINNTKHSMGHAFVLKWMLEGKI